jgi:hypothetical protein
MSQNACQFGLAVQIGQEASGDVNVTTGQGEGIDKRLIEHHVLVLDAGTVRCPGKALTDIIDMTLKGWVLIPPILPEHFSMGFSSHFISIAVNHDFPLLGNRVYRTSPYHEYRCEKNRKMGDVF